MRIGLVGFPGSGKSTVFNALTGQSVDTGFSGGSGKAHYGVVKVPDSRVDKLAALYKPKKITYAEVTFCDLPGGSAAQSLDRSVLNSMREMDALCHVVQAFPGPDGTCPELEDRVSGLEAETILADLEIVERRVARLEKDRSDPRELELMRRVQTHLESESSLRDFDLTDDEVKAVSGYRFLSQKPQLIVVNVAEDSIGTVVTDSLSERLRDRGVGVVELSAQVEMDIAQMDPPDQKEFLDSLGLDEPASHRFVRAAFELIDLISMLTAGEDECRAWPVPRGSPAPKAAGKIHSDIERGFIRAEVIRWTDLVELGSEAKCREAGKQRTEGKAYVVQDGDVINFRFNV